MPGRKMKGYMIMADPFGPATRHSRAVDAAITRVYTRASSQGQESCPSKKPKKAKR